MGIPHRVVVCVILACQVLILSGIVGMKFDELSTKATGNRTIVLDISIKSLFLIDTTSVLLFLTSLVPFIMAPNLHLLYSILAGTVLTLILQVAAILIVSEWYHCLILTACASSTILILVSLNTILSNLLYQSALDTYPSSNLNHRFSNCDLQDLSTFRRYTLDPHLAREQILMHQARSNNRKSFLFVIPADDPSSSYAHPTSDFVDC